MSYPGYPGGGYPPAYPPGAGPYPPQGGQTWGTPGAPVQDPYGGAGGAYPPMAGGQYPTPGQPPYGSGGYPPAPGMDQAAWGYPPPGGAGGYPPPGGTGGFTAYPGAGPGAGFGAPPAGYPAGYPGAPGQPPIQNYGGGGGMPGAPGAYPGPAPPAQPTPSPAPPTPPIGGMAGLSLGPQGTVKPIGNFNVQDDCEMLRKAMKGLGTNEQVLMDLVVNRSNAQRQKIKLTFKTMYGKDLIRDLRSELSGNFEEIMLALFMPTTYYDAWSLQKAIQGAGTNEKVLVEILCSRTNQEIREIVSCYKDEFGRDLEKDIKSDTSGHFKRLLISMCQGNRDESPSVDLALALSDAQKLQSSGEGKLGTDESAFNMILAVRSFPQLQATFQEYIKLSQRDIINTIDREFSGNVKDGLKAIVQCAKNRPVFFAERLFEAMKGAGTDDSTLIRIVTSRSEIDLVNVKHAFLEKYNKTLYKMMEGDTSGDYKRMLQAIVGQN
ncbi:unnamed protein product [Lampetra planeri]